MTRRFTLLLILIVSLVGSSAASAFSDDVELRESEAETWDKMIALLNDLILNLKQNQTLTEVLKDRIPTTSAFATGAFLGYRRG